MELDFDIIPDEKKPLGNPSDYVDWEEDDDDYEDHNNAFIQ